MAASGARKHAGKAHSRQQPRGGDTLIARPADLRDALAPAFSGVANGAGLGGRGFGGGSGGGGAGALSAQPYAPAVAVGAPASWLIEGPADKRRVLKRVAPREPLWAVGRGLTVQVRFQVLDDGTVHSGLALKRGSGYPEIDRLAIESLRRWKFKPSHSGIGLATADVWGIATFRFR